MDAGAGEREINTVRGLSSENGEALESDITPYIYKHTNYTTAVLGFEPEVHES